MPLRGLRDLQFTVNYFNQIKGPVYLEFSSSALGEWKFSLGGWDGDRHWEVSGVERGEAVLDPESCWGGQAAGSER